MYDKRHHPAVGPRVVISPGGSSQMSGTHASSSSLSKLVAECSLPSVVQVVAGCYGNISVNKDNELYVHSTSQLTVVIAESLTGKTITTGRSARRSRTSSAGQTLSLPLDYDGWFELMSVDGRTAPVMISVRQLVDVFPARCLVRKTINAMTADDVYRGDGTLSKRVCRGEQLVLLRVTAQRLLQCRDEKGYDVYLSLNQRGLFSAINGHTAANVYTLRSLLAEFRLPIIVRHVYGLLPTRNSTMTDLRLVGIHSDRMTFVLPLRHAWTSKNVDKRALVAVPSRHASRLTVMAAARDFYYHWIMSDDGLELTKRCNDIASSWKVSVHVVPSSIAAEAAAAAAAVSRSYEGDDATWSRGPIENSVDSGLASSASSPSLACTRNALNNDHDDCRQLEQEIDDIYAMIRYGRDGKMLLCRTRSLDDCVSGGEVFSQKPVFDVHSSRWPAADGAHVPAMPTVITVSSRKCKQPGKVVDVTRLSMPGIGTGWQPSHPQCVDKVKPEEMSLGAENISRAVLSAGHYSQEVAANSGRPTEPPAVSTLSHSGLTEAMSISDDDKASTTPNPPPLRRRSKSLPEVTVPAQPSAVGKSHHKSVLGTFTRSIANIFRRMRPNRTSHTFTVDMDLTTTASERYIRKTYHSDVDVDVIGN